MHHYTELTVVIGGAEDFFGSFTSEGALEAKVKEYTGSNAHPFDLTEIYFLRHEHPNTGEECACIQFAQSLKPDIVIDNRKVDEEAP